MPFFQPAVIRLRPRQRLAAFALFSLSVFALGAVTAQAQDVLTLDEAVKTLAAEAVPPDMRPPLP